MGNQQFYARWVLGFLLVLVYVAAALAFSPLYALLITALLAALVVSRYA